MVQVERVELPAFRFVAERSVHLSYTCKLVEDLGFEPRWSPLKRRVHETRLCQSSKLGARCWNRTSLISIKSRVHQSISANRANLVPVKGIEPLSCSYREQALPLGDTGSKLWASVITRCGDRIHPRDFRIHQPNLVPDEGIEPPTSCL